MQHVVGERRTFAPPQICGKSRAMNVSDMAAVFQRAVYKLLSLMLVLIAGVHPLADVAQAQPGPAVKMSRNGICHERGSRYYGQTVHYTAYPSIRACLNAGGRMPRN
jgi:hypothetical protein